MTKHAIFSVIGILLSITAAAKANTVSKSDLLIKFAPGVVQSMNILDAFNEKGVKAEALTDQWVRVQGSTQKLDLQTLQQDPNIEYVQPNYVIRLMENYRVEDPLRREALLKFADKKGGGVKAIQDNPAIPAAPGSSRSGLDPLLQKQWGMNDIGVQEAWKTSKGNPDMIVAVIDTGVDYTHEDLLPNMWRNPKEIPDNKIDDDGNGFVDDVVGWDFVTNDNKPYDLTTSLKEMLSGEGNPGHGTHCAGNVAARGDNGIGISGVAPNVKIMALRFISEKGSGTTADAIKAIKYAVDNGAKVLSNSWGSEGEDPKEAAENKALRDAIQYAQDKNVLFVAAAGNGHQGIGYNNDTDSKPAYPASYDHEAIISVAAIAVNDRLGGFSNWGARTVDIGAPGVNVFSTMVGNKYSDKVIEIGGYEIDWDGTSMAAPHVAGAAALYWSAHPNKTWREVKEAILGSAKKTNTLMNKTVSNGKLDVQALMKF